MHDGMLRILQGLRPTILQRWEVLLRAQPVTSPLANPDSLVYLMDWTIDRVFAVLRSPSNRRRISARSAEAHPTREACACGMNPLLAYFTTAEQAMLECVLPVLAPREREAVLPAVKLAVQTVALREIQTFCAVCQRRHTPPPASSSTSVASVR